MRTLLLDVGGGDNLGGEVQPLAEVVKTLRMVRLDDIIDEIPRNIPRE